MRRLVNTLWGRECRRWRRDDASERPHRRKTLVFRRSKMPQEILRHFIFELTKLANLGYNKCVKL